MEVADSLLLPRMGGLSSKGTPLRSSIVFQQSGLQNGLPAALVKTMSGKFTNNRSSFVSNTTSEKQADLQLFPDLIPQKASTTSEKQSTMEELSESIACAKILLDFLSLHKNEVEDDPAVLREFELLTVKVLARFSFSESKLSQLLADEGFNGQCYQLSLFRSFDEESLTLSLGNPLSFQFISPFRSLFHIKSI